MGWFERCIEQLAMTGGDTFTLRWRLESSGVELQVYYLCSPFSLMKLIVLTAMGGIIPRGWGRGSQQKYGVRLSPSESISTMTADVASARASSPTSTPPVNNTLDDPANVRRWLQSNHPKQLALLDNFEIELRLGRFSNASSRDGPGGGNTSGAGAQGGTYQYGKERRLVTSRTVELLRAIIGSTRWRNAAQVLTLLRGLGNELHAAGGYREPAIGNVVRRVMYAVRDEADRVSVPSSMGNSDMDKIDELTEEVSSKLRVAPAGKELSLASMLWAHPQHVTMKHSRQQSGDFSDRLRSDSMGSDSGLMTSASKDGSDGAMAIYPPHFYTRRDDLRQSVMEAIQEMMSELEDLHKNINEQATQHIHAGEIILTYALSKTVELVSGLWVLKVA
jgi:translation initiation factor 2B subunit (eIF-2B alpha/beta/delta family)